jgi:hypothetical protein
MIRRTVALVLFTAMLMSTVLGYSYHVANAQSFSKETALLDVKMMYAIHQYASTKTAKHQFLIQLNY